MQQTWRLKLLYDGLCPLCAHEVALLRRLDRRRGRLAFEDIACDTFNPERYGLTMSDVVGSMHAIRDDGAVIRGVEVFRQAYAEVGLGWLLAPTRWPILRSMVEALYRGFARIRPRLSRFRPTACTRDRCARLGS